MNTELKERRKDQALIVVASVYMLFIIIIVSIVILSGCKKPDNRGYGGSGGGQSNNETTQVNMRMTDAPGNYDAVYVEITGAEVHSDVTGWVALIVKPGIYNLLDLTNGKDTLIGSGQVAVGNVSEVRLTLGTHNTLVVDSQTYALSTPSAQQSGLKLQVHAALLKGINYTMLIDFDASKSIVATGHKTYLLKPVLRAITKATDGAIKGVVFPALSQPLVLAVNGTDSFSTHADLITGGFYIGGLQTGSYKVVVMPKSPYRDTAISGIGVTLGAITNTGIIIVK